MGLTRLDRRGVVLVLNAAIVLLVFNAKIYQKERHRQQGAELYLELAPVDPRSLMQGDYMRLRYTVLQEAQRSVSSDLDPDVVVVTLDEDRVAHFSHVGAGGTSREQIRLRVRDNARGRLGFGGADTFLFQEGLAKRYERAAFARVRVDDRGEVMVLELCDAQRRPLTSAE